MFQHPGLFFLSPDYMVVGTRFFLHRDERLPNALSVQHKTVLRHKYLPEYVWTCCFSGFHMKGYADIQTLRHTGKVILIERISVEICWLWAWLSEVMIGFSSVLLGHVLDGYPRSLKSLARFNIELGLERLVDIINNIDNKKLLKNVFVVVQSFDLIWPHTRSCNDVVWPVC